MDKHYGMYRGIVTNNSDPENRYRVKLKVPQLLGQEETNWAWPCVPLNWFPSGPQGSINGSIFKKTPSHSDHTTVGHTHNVSTTGTGTLQSGSATGTGTLTSGSATGSGTDPQGGTVSVTTTLGNLASTVTTTLGNLTSDVTTTGTAANGGTDITGGPQTLTHDHNHDKFVLQESVPRVEQTVWVTFEGGDIDHPIWMGVWS